MGRLSEKVNICPHVWFFFLADLAAPFPPAHYRFTVLGSMLLLVLSSFIGADGPGKPSTANEMNQLILSGSILKSWMALQMGLDASHRVYVVCY